MSAFRLPLRALANPAPVVRQTSKALIANTAPNLNTRSLLRPSLISRADITNPCVSRGFAPNSFAGPSRRFFASRTSLLSAEGKSQENNGAGSKPAQSQSKGLKYLIVLGVLGVVGAVYHKEITHGYRAAERSGRVVGTLAVCINE